MIFNWFWKTGMKDHSELEDLSDYEECSANFYEYPQKVIKRGVIDQINHLNSKIIDFTADMNDENLKEIEKSLELLKKSYNNLKMIRKR
jgi:hypothetical protein